MGIALHSPSSIPESHSSPSTSSLFLAMKRKFSVHYSFLPWFKASPKTCNTRSNPLHVETYQSSNRNKHFLFICCYLKCFFYSNKNLSNNLQNICGYKKSHTKLYNSQICQFFILIFICKIGYNMYNMKKVHSSSQTHINILYIILVHHFLREIRFSLKLQKFNLSDVISTLSDHESWSMK